MNYELIYSYIILRNCRPRVVRKDFWETLSLHNNYFKTITLKISLSPSKDMFQVFACIWNMLHELPFKYKGLKFRFVDIDYVNKIW